MKTSLGKEGLLKSAFENETKNKESYPMLDYCIRQGNEEKRR